MTCDLIHTILHYPSTNDNIPNHVRVLTFLVPHGVRVRGVRGRRLAGLVDRDHSEDDPVLLGQSLSDLATEPRIVEVIKDVPFPEILVKFLAGNSNVHLSGSPPVGVSCTATFSHVSDLSDLFWTM